MRPKLRILKKLNLQNECQTHLGEIGILKIKVQNLETENRTLGSICILRNGTRMDLDKMYIGRKLHDKRCLGYKKSLFSSKSKNPTSPKLNGKQTQNLNDKNVKNKNAKNNKSSYNHTYIYQHNSRRNNNNKRKINYQNSDRNTYNPKGSNKIYFEGSDGWFYELKNQNLSQNETQNNKS